MTQKFKAEEFAEKLQSEEGLDSSLSITGLVKKGGNKGVILFSPGGLCSLWAPVPTSLIAEVEVIGKAPCKDHMHDLVRIEFKKATSTEGQALAQLLSQLSVGAVAGGAGMKMEPEIAPFEPEAEGFTAARGAFDPWTAGAVGPQSAGAVFPMARSHLCVSDCNRAYSQRIASAAAIRGACLARCH